MRTSEFKGIKTILNKYISQSASIAELCVVDNEITFDHLTIGQAIGRIDGYMVKAVIFYIIFIVFNILV